ncbi:membrane dipeptidase [Acidianus sp. RZ1]|uniref:membrane dipeptidase n=1 Tax=Acidianus sp. RZ1 TaxID=1540082 RepID=UPI001490DBBD|nr:membrane dipeptidase [Acidianus sp. RZ1]NON61423.1 peptidase [Acidianus sp. RZ1]
MRFVDMHEDFGFSSQTEDVISGNKQSSIRLLNAASNNAVIFASIFPHVNTVNEISDYLSEKYGHPSKASSPLFQVFLEQVKFYLYLERKGLVTIVRSRKDLDKDGIKFILSLEGADVLTDPYDVYILKELNVLVLGLTWNYDNKFASSCMSKKDYGLTGEGEELVRIANDLGIILDLAHASKRTVIDVTSSSKEPVIASHTNVKALKDHVRNLDNEEIDAIVKTKGIIGVTAINSTLSDHPSIQDLVNHAKYIGDNFGWDSVAFGSDFLGIDETPKGLEDVTKVKELSSLLGDRSEEVLWNNPMRILKKLLKG